MQEGTGRIHTYWAPGGAWSARARPFGLECGRGVRVRGLGAPRVAPWGAPPGSRGGTLVGAACCVPRSRP
eukprot:2326988-Prymnesium_polylepis.2